jgi:glycosyltransferase involved in cell wall biosynthesis
MRIAFVTGHYVPFIGGVEEHVIQLARRLAAKGHDVDVLTHHEQVGDQLPPRTEDDWGVTVRRFPVPMASQHFALSPALLRHLRRHRDRWDVVHTHGYHSAAPLATVLSGIRPYIITPHYHGTGHSPLRKALHPPYRLVGRRIFGNAAATIAVADNERALILSHFPEIADRLEVIPNGVDLDTIKAAEPYRLEQRVVLSAGRLETYKQVDLTISALNLLPEDVILRITGAGPARQALEEQVARDGLGHRVEFLGRLPVEDLHRWFRSARVYVNMSSNEAMPITLLEVLGAGASVVASDIPAHREIARRTSGSVDIIPLRSTPEAVAGAIGAALEQPAAPASIPSWDWVTDRTVDVYARARTAG